ncbi:thioredoxin family protein [Tenacibaculum sp. TC6]|uniref:thioredoxin family protein n=1 Tax=Tenacibaculum sp. TC6 TaxID=3423223 RepID=UPI003D362D66
MKNLIITAMAIFTFGITQAQEWYLDLSEAKSVAVEQDKTILMVFEGSDWCIPCMKLNKLIFSTDEFREYAKDHYVMLKVDFPKRKQNRLSEEQQKKNNKLAEDYNKEGYFPFVVLLDKNGKTLGETGYKNISVKEYIGELEALLKK